MKTLRAMDPTERNQTGHNMDAPEEDYYPRDRKKRPTFAHDQVVRDDHRPDIFPVRITGEMTNTPASPMSDDKANATIAGQLKRGNAKRSSRASHGIARGADDNVLGTRSVWGRGGER